MELELIQTNTQTTNGVDPNSQKQLILNNLQANILKSNGREHVYLLFLRFPDEDPDEPNRVKTMARAWIQKNAEKYVTSADKQLKDAAERRVNSNHDGGLLGCFFLSAIGYKALGFSLGQADSLFTQGMKARQNYEFTRDKQRFTIDNKDPHPKDWQPFYQGKIHAMLLIAGDNKAELDKTKASIEASLKGVAEVWVEHGRRLFYNNNNKNDIEPFGYRDGISNPSFFFEGHQPDDASNFNLTLAQDLVLVPDSLADEAHCYGSYFVFRKLEQDGEAFKGLVKNLARYEGKDQDLAGARIVGRFRDGTPVTKFRKPIGLRADTIDFNFDGDDGCGCPSYAHIRKANPRDERGQNIRIVRRGIPYNEIEAQTGRGIGILFMCYQRSIYHQFELIQRRWIDNRNHPVPETGVDRLVGQNWSEGSHHERPVTLQGGEYFFAPSLSFLLKKLNEVAT